MMTAPFPQNECESVTEYNNRHFGKAWAIMGMTWLGSAYCRTCAGHWPTYDEDIIESPVPVFASDKYEDMTCDECGNHLA
jgi:hypothetical protein